MPSSGTSIQVLPSVRLHHRSQETGHATGVLARKSLIAAGMLHTGYGPLLFGSRLGGVKHIHHPVGHKSVSRAVNKEHGPMAAGHLTQGRSFAETPAVAQATQAAGHVEQREFGQAVTVVQLTPKLIPHRSVAAIGHKGTHTTGQGIAGKHHGGGGPPWKYREPPCAQNPNTAYGPRQSTA